MNQLRSHRRLPAAVIALLFCLAAVPALPGGRDVPDAQSEMNPTTLPGGGRIAYLICPDDPLVVSGTDYFSTEIRVDDNGQISVRPALVGQIKRAAQRLFGFAAPDACPAN